MRLLTCLSKRWPMMPRNSAYTFEICVDAPAAIAASAEFADRIELCSALDIGGITPDIGMMERAASFGVETHVLIRPRSGDFTMDSDDVSTAITSIETVRNIGLKGVVIGAERDGAVDLKALESMARAADGLDITLHRVIDVVDDPIAALEVAIELGFSRILTSGAAPSAVDGMSRLSQLHDIASNRIEIMAGSGINSANLPEIIAGTPITSFHASCSKMSPLDERYAALGFGSARRVFDPLEARKISSVLERPHSKKTTT